MRLILVPQYPQKLRYQEWWPSEFAKNLSPYFDDIIILGKNFVDSDLENSNYIGELFSPVNTSIEFETQQINEYMNLELRDDDILLQLDTSFPGFFNNVLYHKRPRRAFSFCHATSVNNYDYFNEVNDNFNNSKLESEKANFSLFDLVFVSSLYHKNKLESYNFPNNIVSLRALPNPPIQGRPKKFSNRRNDIVSVSRPSYQKVNLAVENFIEKEFNTKIVRKNCENWEQYYEFLGDSKIVLINSKEDTYGYAIIDAYMNGCNVVAPRAFAYPEIVPEEDLEIQSYTSLLYDCGDYMLKNIRNCINSNLDSCKFTKLKNDYFIRNFYDNLVQKMFSV